MSCSTKGSGIEKKSNRRSHPRTRVACDFCRKRKIKCNGDEPCGQCIEGGNKECKYSGNRDSKPARGFKSDNQQTIKELNRRISTIESRLLATKIEGQKIKGSDGNGVQGRGREIAGEERTDIGEKEKKKEKEKDEWRCPLKAAKSTLMQCFASHSIFCIFSRKSISWMERKLGSKDELVTPIRNLPTVLSNALSCSAQAFLSEDTTRAGEEVFPDRRIVFQILETNYELIHVSGYICSLSSVRELFLRYYSQSNWEWQNNPSLQKFEYSELLIMNIALAISLLRGNEFEELPMKDFTNEQLKTLGKTFFNNAIKHYEKVVHINEGIRTIQAICLLMIYVDSSEIMDLQLNYKLSSVAIRYAQELGLHRFETLDNLHQETARWCRRIWWFCQHWDIESSYRSGRPPLIHSSDISTLMDDDPVIFQIRNENDSIGLFEKRGAQSYFQYFILLIDQVRLKSYEKLFSVQAQKSKKEESIRILREINSEMLEIAEQMEPEVRPILNNRKIYLGSNPRFYRIYDPDSVYIVQHKIYVQLTFFSHLLTINRIPSLLDTYTNDPETELLGNIALDSARTILQIILAPENMSSDNVFRNCIAFFAFKAFVGLLAHCLSTPNNSSLQDDCRLLTESALSFFSQNNADPRPDAWTRENIFQSRITTMDVITRVLLGLLIKVLRSEHNVDCTVEFDGLKEYLLLSNSIYPEVFNECLRKFGLDLGHFRTHSQLQPSSSPTLNTNAANGHGNSVSPKQIIERSGSPIKLRKSSIESILNHPDPRTQN